MPDRAFDALLCDVDGVLRLWGDSMERIDRTHGLPEGTLASVAFAPDRLEPAVTGRVTDEEWRAAVVEDLTPLCGSPTRARAVVEDWSGPVGEVDPAVVALLTAARRHVPVALVSNATSRLERDLAALGVAELVDAIVNTSRIGFAKPDVRVYQHAAARLGAEPSRCLFVDDAPGHVEGARAAGMTGVVYEGADALRAMLSPLWDRPATVVGDEPQAPSVDATAADLPGGGSGSTTA